MNQIPPLPEATILLVEVGTTAHGTGLPGGEDHDEMGVGMESPTQVLGLDHKGFANRSPVLGPQVHPPRRREPVAHPTAPAVPLALARWLG